MTPQPKVGVGVFVIKNGAFLMGRRKGAHGAGSWSVPGGHLEYLEAPEQTAAREVWEETGLHITNIRFGAVTNDVFRADNTHYVTLWMLSDWKSGEVAIKEPDTFIDMGWYDFDSLPEPLFLPWQQLLHSDFMPHLRQALRR